MQTDKIIIIIGNDGTGKSSIVKTLREFGFNVWERSVADIANYPKHLGTPKEIDLMTLDLPLDIIDPIAFTDFINRMFIPNVYWFMIDLKVETILKRIANRSSFDIFETPKSLNYFRKRYLQFAYSVGIPIITNDTPIEVTLKNILSFVEDPIKYDTIHNFMLHNKDRSDLEQYINFNPPSDKENDFLYPILKSVFGPIEVQSRKSISENIWLEKLIEGESKQVFCIRDKWNHFKNKVIIFLKPTIYSHSKQATGEIPGIEKIRAKATNYFLEMMWRNGLYHSYYCINTNGVILSEQILDIPMIEVVVKRYCAGTDKHSFYGMVNKTNMCYQMEAGSSDVKYLSGPYVRFDWRNPNHLVTYNNLLRNPVESPWYYLYEAHIGKEKFFEEFLGKSEYCKPMGDKCVPEHLAKMEINTENAKRNVLKLFHTISLYFSKMNLEIQDVCFMVDKSGNIFWSEINQDCMRIKALGGSFDKDLWRAGGSDAKQKILDKWGEFNPMLSKLLRELTFMKEKCYEIYPYYEAVRKTLKETQPDTEYLALYRSILPIISRRVMVTCDLYDGKPSLVKSGKVVEHHSNGSIEKAFEYMGIFPDILLVDLNGAMEEGYNNRKIIKENATRYYTHCGGGLRTIEDIQDVLSASARRIVVSTNLTQEFLEKIPKDRLIVELSVNEYNQILTHGRKGLNDMTLSEAGKYLSDLGVEVISVTFHQTEGHLLGINRDHVSEVYNTLSVHKFEKIFIAGGISSIGDMEFIWNLGGIPQLGSAIWKSKLSIGDIYSAMVSATNDSEIPAIIQSNDGKVKGLVYLNREAIIKTCETRVLWRYSRRYDKVMQKGESSGNIQRIIKMAVDCDSDTLLITVDANKPFCHTGNASCFSLQTPIKGNLVDLMKHITKSSELPTSYANQMAKYPGLALMKTMEEFWEVMTSDHLGSIKYPNDHELADHKLRECCDFLAHFFMFLNSRKVNIEDVLNELNARRWNPKLIKSYVIPKSDVYVIGITANKYSKKTDDFVKNTLGIHIIRPDGRDMKLRYEILDMEKMKLVGIPTDRELSFVGIRPKDMPSLMTTDKLNAVVTYNTVMDNFPKVTKEVISVADMDLRLALIHRIGENINIDQSTKILVACEHPVHIENYLYEQYKMTDKFSLDRVIGSSESFLVNTTTKKYSLCDALVESGRTLQENGLEIWKTVLDRGQVTIGFYTTIKE